MPGAETISVEIAAGRSKKLSTADVRGLVYELLGISSEVTQLHVVGAETDDDRFALVDLLGAQLQTERQLTATSKKRHALSERWAALRSAYDEWKRNGRLG